MIVEIGTDKQVSFDLALELTLQEMNWFARLPKSVIERGNEHEQVWYILESLFEQWSTLADDAQIGEKLHAMKVVQTGAAMWLVPRVSVVLCLVEEDYKHLYYRVREALTTYTAASDEIGFWGSLYSALYSKMNQTSDCPKFYHDSYLGGMNDNG